MDVFRAGAYRIEVEPAGEFACWRVLEGRQGRMLAEFTIEARGRVSMVRARAEALTWLRAHLDSVRAVLDRDAHTWMMNGGEV